MVIDAQDLMGEVVLKLIEREPRGRLAVIVAARRWAVVGRARQQPASPHQGADEAFDMPAEPRPSRWPKKGLYALVLQRAHQDLDLAKPRPSFNRIRIWPSGLRSSLYPHGGGGKDGLSKRFVNASDSPR